MLRGCRLHVDAGVAGTSGGNEWLGWVDRRYGFSAQPSDQLGGECARPAADVDHPLPGSNSGEIRELWGEQCRVPAHEAVIRVRGDVEAQPHNPQAVSA